MASRDVPVPFCSSHRLTPSPRWYWCPNYLVKIFKMSMSSYFFSSLYNEEKHLVSVSELVIRIWNNSWNGKILFFLLKWLIMGENEDNWFFFCGVSLTQVASTLLYLADNSAVMSHKSLHFLQPAHDWCFCHTLVQNKANLHIYACGQTLPLPSTLSFCKLRTHRWMCKRHQNQIPNLTTGTKINTEI